MPAPGAVDRVFVKNHKVGRKAFANQTTIAEPKRLRRQRSHFPDRILERDQFQLTNVSSQHAGVVTVTTRVRHALVRLAHAAV